MGGFDPENDAQSFYKAMRGFGADHKELLELIGTRTNEHLQLVRKAYEDKYPGRCLHRDIDAETSGPYQEALIGLLMTPPEYEVRCVHTAIKGIGCSQEVLLQHCVHRAPEEMQAMCLAYEKIVGHTVETDLQAELRGQNEHLFTALLQGGKQELNHLSEAELMEAVDGLYNAGRGRWGSNVGAFIKLLAGNCQQASQIATLYGKKYGETLGHVLEKEVGDSSLNVVREALEALLEPHDLFFAKLLDAALGGGKDKDRRDWGCVVRVLVSRRQHLTAINRAHIQLKGMPLCPRLEAEAPDKNLKHVLVSITTGL